MNEGRKDIEERMTKGRKEEYARRENIIRKEGRKDMNEGSRMNMKEGRKERGRGEKEKERERGGGGGGGHYAERKRR